MSLDKYVEEWEIREKEKREIEEAKIRAIQILKENHKKCEKLKLSEKPKSAEEQRKEKIRKYNTEYQRKRRARLKEREDKQ